MADNDGWEERLREALAVNQASHMRDLGAEWYASVRPADLSRALAELSALRREGKALIDALDRCEPHITNAFQLGYTVRGATYTGPRYDKELAAFRKRIEGEGQEHER